MSISIRKGRPGDETRLRAIHEASWRDAYAPFVPTEAFGAPLDAVMSRRWDIWPLRPAIFVAEDDAHVLGFAATLDQGQGRWLLDNLHLDPAHRGRGTGTMLLKTVAGFVLDMDASALWLEVLAGNTGARRFYRAMGGTEDEGTDTKLLGYPADYVSVVWEGEALTGLAAKSDQYRSKDA